MLSCTTALYVGYDDRALIAPLQVASKSCRAPSQTSEARKWRELSWRYCGTKMHTVHMPSNIDVIRTSLKTPVLPESSETRYASNAQNKKFVSIPRSRKSERREQRKSECVFRIRETFWIAQVQLQWIWLLCYLRNSRRKILARIHSRSFLPSCLGESVLSTTSQLSEEFESAIYLTIHSGNLAKATGYRSTDGIIIKLLLNMCGRVGLHRPMCQYITPMARN